MPTNRSSARTLFRGGTVVTMDRNLGDLPQGDVLVEGTRIVAVASDLCVEDALIIDARNALVMPGFVNTHQHAWLGALRGLLPNIASLPEYFELIPFALGRYYQPYDMFISTMLTSLSCLDAGITTILDACHNTLTPKHSDAALDAFVQSGIRALHMVGKPLGEIAAPHWPGDLDRLRERLGGADGRVSVGLFANVTDADAWAFARERKFKILSEFGNWEGTVLDGLSRENLLGNDNIFNHCTQLSAVDWTVLRSAGVNVTLNPRSDSLFGLEADGLSYQSAVEHGIMPGLGIDIDTSHSGDMFGEMRACFYQQRTFSQRRKAAGDAAAPRPIDVRAILEAATINGANCIGVGDVTGSLAPEKEADIIMIRSDGIGVMPSRHALGNVVHMANRSDVATVMVAGRLRKHEGRLIDVDLEKIRELAESSRRHLLQAANFSEGHFSDRFPAA
ncbi:amidohydrolase family protein [Mesorhizobium sp.]|uniref:amidohydrolase family protein n=1 Tax=Mesorhizobium sp. TaxID=1871066 RepID=UPI0025FB4838|nr:amidohydrolase family protein [Mesorhizobium sp.]